MFECLVLRLWDCLGRTRRRSLVGRDVPLGADFEVSKAHVIAVSTLSASSL